MVAVRICDPVPIAIGILSGEAPKESLRDNLLSGYDYACTGSDFYLFSVVFYAFNGLQEHFVVPLMKKKQSWSVAESMSTIEKINYANNIKAVNLNPDSYRDLLLKI